MRTARRFAAYGRACTAYHRVTPSRVLPWAALFALAAAAGGARAADPDELQAVVITATRIPTPQLEVGSSLTLVTAADIEARQERTFADVLKDIPGLNVVQTGGPGGVTSVFMRGTNSNHTKVFVDGVDISDPSNSTGAFDFGQLLTRTSSASRYCAARKAACTAPTPSAG